MVPLGVYRRRAWSTAVREDEYTILRCIVDGARVRVQRAFLVQYRVKGAKAKVWMSLENFLDTGPVFVNPLKAASGPGAESSEAAHPATGLVLLRG